MIPRSYIVAGLAVSGSLGLHGLAFGFAPTPPQVDQAGGRTAQVAVLGHGFADLVAGVSTPVTPVSLTEHRLPASVSPVTPARTTPVTAEAISPTAPATAVVSPSVVTQPSPPVVATAGRASATQTTVTTVPPTSPAAQPAQQAAGSPLEMARIAAPPVVDSVTRVDVSPRPRQRVAERPQAIPTAQGNADRTEKRGSQSNAARAPDPSGQTQVPRQARVAGNAAVSNYPGKVLRKLSRTRRPSLGASGAARVSFALTPAGGLGQLSISKSSGVADLDRAALQLVRRAAPFPAPPPGAQTQFSYTFAVK